MLALLATAHFQRIQKNVQSVTFGAVEQKHFVDAFRDKVLEELGQGPRAPKTLYDVFFAAIQSAVDSQELGKYLTPSIVAACRACGVGLSTDTKTDDDCNILVAATASEVDKFMNSCSETALAHNFFGGVAKTIARALGAPGGSPSPPGDGTGRITAPDLPVGYTPHSGRSSRFIIPSPDAAQVSDAASPVATLGAQSSTSMTSLTQVTVTPWHTSVPPPTDPTHDILTRIVASGLVGTEETPLIQADVDESKARADARRLELERAAGSPLHDSADDTEAGAAYSAETPLCYELTQVNRVHGEQQVAAAAAVHAQCLDKGGDAAAAEAAAAAAADAVDPTPKLTVLGPFLRRIVDAIGRTAARYGSVGKAVSPVVFRGMNYKSPADRVGGTITFHALTSVTMDSGVARSFIRSSSATLYVIFTEGGAMLQHMSKFPHENEVLLASGAAMRVTSAVPAMLLRMLGLKARVLMLREQADGASDDSIGHSLERSIAEQHATSVLYERLQQVTVPLEVSGLANPELGGNVDAIDVVKAAVDAAAQGARAHPHVLVMSGDAGAGKTSLCLTLQAGAMDWSPTPPAGGPHQRVVVVPVFIHLPHAGDAVLGGAGDGGLAGMIRRKLLQLDDGGWRALCTGDGDDGTMYVPLLLLDSYDEISEEIYGGEAKMKSVDANVVVRGGLADAFEDGRCVMVVTTRNDRLDGADVDVLFGAGRGTTGTVKRWYVRDLGEAASRAVLERRATSAAYDVLSVAERNAEQAHVDAAMETAIVDALAHWRGGARPDGLTTPDAVAARAAASAGLSSVRDFRKTVEGRAKAVAELVGDHVWPLVDEKLKPQVCHPLIAGLVLDTLYYGDGESAVPPEEAATIVRPSDPACKGVFTVPVLGRLLTARAKEGRNVRETQWDVLRAIMGDDRAWGGGDGDVTTAAVVSTRRELAAILAEAFFLDDRSVGTVGEVCALVKTAVEDGKWDANTIAGAIAAAVRVRGGSVAPEASSSGVLGALPDIALGLLDGCAILRVGDTLGGDDAIPAVQVSFAHMNFQEGLAAARLHAKPAVLLERLAAGRLAREGEFLRLLKDVHERANKADQDAFEAGVKAYVTTTNPTADCGNALTALGQVVRRVRDLQLEGRMVRGADMSGTIVSGVVLRDCDADGLNVGGACIHRGVGHNTATLEGAAADSRAGYGLHVTGGKLRGVVAAGGLKQLWKHDGRVSSVAMTRDERRVYSASGNVVRIVDVEGGECLHTLMEGHTKRVTSVAVNADGSRVVTGSEDKNVRVWDGESGQLIHTLEGHGNEVKSVTISDDGRRVASGSDDKTVRVWDAVAGRPLLTLQGHTNYVYSVALSADGGRVVSGSLDRSVRVWDTETGNVIHTMEGHAETVSSVAVSADWSRIVSGSDDKTVRVWDAATGRLVHVLEGHRYSVKAVAVSADGSRVVSGSGDNTVRVWDASTGSLVHALEGHTELVVSVAVSGNGRRAVSGSWDNTLRVWDGGTGRLVHPLEGHTYEVTSVAMTADGSRIVSASGDVLCGSGDRTVCLWDAVNGRLIHTMEGHTETVSTVAVSADGGRVVSGSGDNTVRVWDASTGLQVHVLEEHTETVNAVAVSADGSRVASGGDDMTVLIWDAESGCLIHTLTGHTEYVTSVALCANGSRVVSGSADGSVRLWDCASSVQIHEFEGHTSDVFAVDISADGSRIVSGSADRKVRVCDAATGGLLFTMEGHTANVLAVAVSADGRRVVSGSLDNTVRVWDAGAGSLIQTSEGHAASVTCVAMSADGEAYASGAADKGIRIHNYEDNTYKPVAVIGQAAARQTLAGFFVGRTVNMNTSVRSVLEVARANVDRDRAGRRHTFVTF